MALDAHSGRSGSDVRHHRKVGHDRLGHAVGAVLGIVAGTGLGCGSDLRHFAVQTAEVWPMPPRARLDFAYVLGGLLLDGWPAWEIEDMAAATSEALALGAEPSPPPTAPFDDVDRWFTEVRCRELRLDRDCEGAAPAYCEDDAPTGKPAMSPVATARHGVWRVRAFELGECPRQVLDGEV